MNIKFFLNFEPNPPTVTHQEKKVRVVSGRPVFYMPPELASARALLAAKLRPFAPKEPLDGPVRLSVSWVFRSPQGWRGPLPAYKVTKPDTDNLQKMLKDVMTQCGFWKDDAQVCMEQIVKYIFPATAKHGIFIDISTLERSAEK